MKIGELAKLCGVPQATIRYYISNGLLIPDDSSPQFNFTDREYQDLQQILKMKQQKFTLSEIHQYLSLVRHSNFIEPDTIAECLKILDQKKQELRGQMEALERSIDGIEEEIETLKTSTYEHTNQTGVPLSALDLLVCPHCKKQLRLEQAVIEDGVVLSGTLQCVNYDVCDSTYRAEIERGIVKTHNHYTEPYDQPDLHRGLYRGMKQEFSTALQKSYDLIGTRLTQMDLSGKIVLEANINGYFFLYHHLHFLPEDCICVIIDKYPQMLEMYKNLIDCLNTRHNILYIADASMNYPLKEHCVDLHISFFGETEHQLYHKNTYLYDAKGFFKRDAAVLGAFLSYEIQSQSRKRILSKYPEGNERLFQIGYLAEDYKYNAYKLDYSKVGATTDTGIKQYSYACQVPGDPLSVYHFYAKRA